ncbi:sugar ABC transporter substrate-binding protein [Catellatospora sp. KI3]|uniref:ABC transporter substrate-binding protein n=1 Tax=Catellatospora sp. KI3 TaxID=3041620 RepID=UPI002482F9FE|nr:sugar ABC transporter substrate-binding protein [Catellatospora sp. KI3]MDI1462595.1 sugar ABC transporter substrate-binding protein [Catellatospora sp. KI3]
MIRRKMLAAVGLAMAALLPLTACGSGDDTESGPVELTVAVWSLASTPEFQTLFDAFHKANPDITVKPVDILAADYPTKVTTMLAGGDTTDVITMKTLADYVRFSGRGQLQDLTASATAQAGKLAGLDAYNQGGKYFALPYRQDFWVLYYNKKLFDAAKQPYPENLTWDQYVELAKKLTSGSGETKVYGAYQHVWRSVVHAIAAAQTGGDQLGGDYKFLADQYRTALALQDAGATLDYGTAVTQKTGYASMFESGKAAMVPMGSWFIAKILADKKAGTTDVDWGIAPMPQRTGTTGVTTFGAPTAFAVNKKAKHSAAAQKFVEFASSLEGAKAITGIGVVPAFSSDEIRAQYFTLPGMPTDDLSKKAFAPDKVNPEMPVSDKTAKVDTILAEEHQLIMTKEKAIDDGIKEMETRVKNEVN